MSIHQGDLKVMSKKKTTWHKKKKKKPQDTRPERQDIFTSKEEDRQKPERIVTKTEMVETSAKINN